MRSYIRLPDSNPVSGRGRRSLLAPEVAAQPVAAPNPPAPRDRRHDRLDDTARLIGATARAGRDLADGFNRLRQNDDGDPVADWSRAFEAAIEPARKTAGQVADPSLRAPFDGRLGRLRDHYASGAEELDRARRVGRVGQEVESLLAHYAAEAGRFPDRLDALAADLGDDLSPLAQILRPEAWARVRRKGGLELLGGALDALAGAGQGARAGELLGGLAAGRPDPSLAPLGLERLDEAEVRDLRARLVARETPAPEKDPTRLWAEAASQVIDALIRKQPLDPEQLLTLAAPLFGGGLPAPRREREQSPDPNGRIVLSAAPEPVEESDKGKGEDEAQREDSRSDEEKCLEQRLDTQAANQKALEARRELDDLQEVLKAKEKKPCRFPRRQA